MPDLPWNPAPVAGQMPAGAPPIRTDEYGQPWPAGAAKLPPPKGAPPAMPANPPTTNPGPPMVMPPGPPLANEQWQNYRGIQPLATPGVQVSGVSAGPPPMPLSSQVGQQTLADQQAAQSAMMKNVAALAPPPGRLETLLAQGAPMIQELHGHPAHGGYALTNVMGANGPAMAIPGTADREDTLAALQQARADELRRTQLGGTLAQAGQYPQLYGSQAQMADAAMRIQWEMGVERQAKDAETATYVQMMNKGKSHEEAMAEAKFVGNGIRRTAGQGQSPGGAAPGQAPGPDTPESYAPEAAVQFLKDTGITDTTSGQVKGSFDADVLAQKMLENAQKMQGMRPQLARQLGLIGVPKAQMDRAMSEALVRYHNRISPSDAGVRTVGNYGGTEVNPVVEHRTGMATDYPSTTGYWVGSTFYPADNYLGGFNPFNPWLPDFTERGRAESRAKAEQLGTLLKLLPR